MMRRIVLIFLFALIGLALAGVMLWRDFSDFRDRPVTDGPVMVWLAPGTTYTGMVRELERLGLVRADWRWRLLARLEPPKLQAGEYLFEAGASPRAMIERMRAGRVRMHRVTLVEGWTFQRALEVLENDPRLTATGIEPTALMRDLGCAGCAPEGRFLPETYFVTRGASDTDVLKRAYRAMQQALETAWNNRAEGLPLETPEELLTLASLIERETGLASERTRIAGVFVRRLRRGMRLQTDPAVMYGVENFDGRLTYRDLRTDHPWNTYTRHGLPPTPIALPGRAALEAAARPADGTALYFVARGDGSHHFSDTLAEHNAAVNRYIRGDG